MQGPRADSLPLTVPEDVTGLLRKSVTIPCTYSPSALYTEVEVTWYINIYTTIIRRDETGDHIPRSNNRDRISINHDRKSGDVSLTLKNLAYSDRGTYTCEVKWLSRDGINKIRKTANVNLIVIRAFRSTTSPTSLSPVVIPTSASPSSHRTTGTSSSDNQGSSNVKIPVWVFVLTIILIVLFFSVIIICIMFRTMNKTGHIYELPSVRYESFPHQAPVHIHLSENNEYEVMTKARESEYSVIPKRFSCASEQSNASV
ncbi:hepatitis A virus cellular receptor 2 homolog isoform X2 [Heptranchias perlo]|uniref:hepatitis A virus cellular receptor 2 homolog isoform X2 n=1 Tax=Heptranchias perlo TaxID=212740 RepID=UPI00355A8C2F